MTHRRSLIVLACLLAGLALGAWLQARPRAFRWLLIVSGIFLIMLLGKWDAVNFIYFQF